jgi:hypothetical protein
LNVQANVEPGVGEEEVGKEVDKSTGGGNQPVLNGVDDQRVEDTLRGGVGCRPASEVQNSDHGNGNDDIASEAAGQPDDDGVLESPEQGDITSQHGELNCNTESCGALHAGSLWGNKVSAGKGA